MSVRAVPQQIYWIPVVLPLLVSTHVTKILLQLTLKAIKDTKDSPNVTCSDPREPPAKRNSLLRNGNELTTSEARVNRLKDHASEIYIAL